MQPDILIVFAITVTALILFMVEIFSVGLVAMAVMAGLMITGVLTTDEALSGFSSRATITIGAMFMLSEGVRRTGALDQAASLLARTAGGNFRVTLTTMMLVVGVISAMINNTAAIAIFIPVIISLSESLKVSPSRILMPISFASMFGGVCTLVGTSTNILVSEIAVEHGLPSIGMFELTPVGLVFMAAGILYLLVFGIKLVPARRESGQMRGYDLAGYISDVVVLEDSILVGKPLSEDSQLTGADVEVLSVKRDGKVLPGKAGDIEPEVGDVLHIHGHANHVSDVLERAGLELVGKNSIAPEEEGEESLGLIEAVIASDSPLARNRVREIRSSDQLDATLVAVRQRGSLRHEGLGGLRLKAGDCLLLSANAHQVKKLEQDAGLHLVNRLSRKQDRSNKMPLALAIVLGVIISTAVGLAPVALNAIVGVILMMITGCLQLQEGIKSVHWEVILLLAGMIPLGVAMEKTGGAALLADGLLTHLGSLGPRAVLSGLLLLTMLITSVLNNQASAVLLAPMVISLAQSMSVDPRPFLIAVTFGASLSFITPIGYQTNTMIYEPGQYRFTDFLRVGLGLNIILWIIGSLLIPMAWPL